MAERMEIVPISREHLRRTVQIKKMVEDVVNKAEAESIRIDKKRKREQAKASKETVKRFMSATYDMLQALEDIISCGCNRILTSGQVPKAPDGKELIKELVEKAGERIIILPGSGIRADNIRELAKYTRAKEFHSSARKSIPSAMQFQSDSMHEQLENITVDAQEIQRMKQALISLAVS